MPTYKGVEISTEIARDKELMAQFGVKFALKPYGAQQMPVVPDVTED